MSNLLTRDDFFQYFHTCTNLLDQFTRQLVDISPPTHEYLKEMHQYNVPHGKLIRGLLTVHCYQSLVNNPSPADIEKVSALGWCIEWIQASFLVLDDIMDHSETRRGRPCWYKLPKVGEKAINDGLLLEGACDFILRHYFSDKPHLFIKLRHLFDEVKFKTQVGQLLDTSTSDGDFDLNNFSKERYNQIVKYKTAFYTFYLPVFCGLISSEVEYEQTEQLEKLTLLIGYYFQVQDDYLDCYGDPNVTGKIGTDIQDRKCSWLAVTFLENALPEEKASFADHYGKNDEANIAFIKNLYEVKGLKRKFSEFEDDLFKQCTDIISSIPKAELKVFFEKLLALLFKRQK